MKPKVLAKVCIMEVGAHYMKVRQAHFLLRNFPTVESHFRLRTEVDDISTFVPNRGHKLSPALVKRSRVLASIAFYSRVMKSLFRASTLWITTGPEQNNLADSIAVVALTRLFRGRVALAIGHSKKWLPVGVRTGFSAQRILRQSLLKSVDVLLFESETQRSYFLSRCPDWSGKAAVVPTYCSDSRLWLSQGEDQSEKSARIWSSEESIRIGVLGGVTRSRRDYDSIIRAIDGVENLKIEFVILGRTDDSDAGEILDSLRSQATVHAGSQFLSLKELGELGDSCEVLIAPLRQDAGQGVSSGSGTFGDAIFLNKQLIVPQECDPLREYESFAHYYRDSDDLRGLLQAAPWREREKQSRELFEAFSRNSVVRRIDSDLAVPLFPENDF